MKPLLEILDLSIEFRPPPGEVAPVIAVRHISFSVNRGDIFALVGSTGCGKTATVLSLGGLLPPKGRVLTGEARFRLDEDEQDEGVDLLALRIGRLRKLRRGPIAYLFRDIGAQLNPRLTIRQHIRESIELAGRKREYRDEKSWMPILYEVGLVEPESMLGKYPDQLPEITVQRMLIAMALMRGVELLIADEPTSALDAIAENQILRLLSELRESRGLTIFLLTHNFGILRNLADRVAVMFEGSIVETGPAEQILRKPKSGYTRALLDCVPKLGEKRTRLGEVDHVTVRDQVGRT